MSDTPFLEKTAVRIVIKTLLVLIVTPVSALFFGLCVPFFLLSMEVLPSFGVGSVIYVFAGGLAGLLFGGISSIVSLARSPKLVTPYYIVLLVSLSVLTLAYYVAYMNIDLLSRHL